VTEAAHRTVPDPACEDARALASLALDDALDDVGRRHLARHLAECPACAAFAADIGALTALLRGAPPEPYRAGPISAETPGRRPRSYRAQWATTVTAVAAVVITVASLPHDTPSSPSGPSTTVASARTGVAPVKLPIGQRSAASDFTTQ
jgi:anti-sigma factor RsiW